MKRTIVLGLAALAVLAGCSKTVVEQPAAPADNDAWVYDETLPVPVAFVAPGLTLTKAEVAGAIEGSVMNGLDIGVFGLATNDGVPAWENGGTLTTHSMHIIRTDRHSIRMVHSLWTSRSDTQMSSGQRSMQ